MLSSLTRFRIFRPLLSAFLVLAPLAPAQEETPASASEYRATTVVSTGTATVYTLPTHAVFWIHHTETADSLKLAVEAAARFDPALREKLTVKELRPTLVETSTPAIVEPEVEGKETVRVSTELRFTMLSFATGDSGQAKFAELCDTLKALAADLGALSGPHFITDQKNLVIQDAVREAAKAAHPAGQGAADSMNATIRAVDRMEVVSVVWSGPADSQVDYPTMAQLACTAEVRVAYTVE